MHFEDKKIPSYFGWFIIIALLPQIVGINGSTVDTVYKILVICILAFFLARNRELTKVSRFFALFMFASITDVCVIIVNNGTGIKGELVSLFTSLLLLYVLYDCIIGTVYIKRENIYAFYKMIVYLMLVASLYNMIMHFNSLIHITSLTVYNTENICSFFDNKNTYGVFLIFGTLAATILKILQRQRRWSLFAIIFVINELMAMCRTAIIISLVMIAISVFVEEKGRIRNIFFMVAVVVAFIILLKNNVAFNSFVFDNLLGSTKSMETRNDYFAQMLPLIRGSYSIFGYGTTKAMQLAIQYTGNQYYHNTYLKVMISGGGIRMFLQLSVIVLSFCYGFKCRLYDKMTGSLCVMSTLVYVIYAWVESVILFDSPVVAIMATMFIVSMPILLYQSFSLDNNGEDGGVEKL